MHQYYITITYTFKFEALQLFNCPEFIGWQLMEWIMDRLSNWIVRLSPIQIVLQKIRHATNDYMYK
jgi:hypothetical protein